jgi:hypothetical protein
MATLYNPKSNPMLRWNDFKPKPLPKDKTTTKKETYITPGVTLKSTDRNSYVNEVLKKYETRAPIYGDVGDGQGVVGYENKFNLGTTGHWDNEVTVYGDRAQAEQKYKADIDKIYQAALDFNKLHTHTRTWKETEYADQASVILENARNESAYKQGLMNEWKQFEAMQNARSQAGRGTRLYWSEEFDSKTGKRLDAAPAAKQPSQQGTYTGAPSSNEEFIDPTSTTQLNSLLSDDAPTSPILTNNQQQRKRQQLLAS